MNNGAQKYSLGLTGIVLCLLAVCGARSLFAEVPPTLGYQGFLTRTNGMALDTTLNITFLLYADSTGGRSLWTELHPGVPVEKGAFFARLGQTAPLSASNFGHETRWLALRIGNNSEMTPRLKFGSVAYAYRTETIDNADGGAINGDVRISGKAQIGLDCENPGAAAFVAGSRNFALNDYTVVAGGDSNNAFGSHSNVSGGYGNVAMSDYSNVGGGRSNIAGLLEMRLDDLRSPGDGDYATVGGGQNNVAAGDHATVGGGRSNQAQGAYSTVAGGHFNNAMGDSAAIGGGTYNIAGTSATVCGGNDNTAYGAGAVVGGGYGNRADSTMAVVPGGDNCFAGQYSFAAGHRAKAYLDGCFRWADSYNADFSAPDTANSFSVRATGGVYLFTSGNLTSGVRMAAGASAWNSISDSTKKRNIREVDTRDMLTKVTQLPVKQWSYLAQDPSVEHIGPMAQDFWKLFHVGDDSLSISTIDPSGIALAAIQELARQNQDLQKELAALRAQLQTHLAQEQQTRREEK